MFTAKERTLLTSPYLKDSNVKEIHLYDSDVDDYKKAVEEMNALQDGRRRGFMNKNKMLSYEEYKVAKVQHHGTTAYWSDELPNAMVYLISNSGTANLKWSIDARYGKYYSDKTTCTNDTSNRCGYYSCSQQCNMCNIGSGKTEVLIDCATI